MQIVYEDEVKAVSILDSINIHIHSHHTHQFSSNTPNHFVCTSTCMQAMADEDDEKRTPYRIGAYGRARVPNGFLIYSNCVYNNVICMYQYQYQYQYLHKLKHLPLPLPQKIM